MTAFKEIQKHYRQRDLAALEWKKQGKKVIGYFCDNVPEELIMAAGFFPLRISGDPLGGTEVAETYRLPSPYVHVTFVESMMNKLLTGKYDFLDYLVIPHARDPIDHMWMQLQFVQELDPHIKLPEIYYLDNLHTLNYTSNLYNRERIIEFRTQLEKWSGKKITDKALEKAIVVTNENKALLKKVAALRAAEIPRISGVEALQLIGTSMFMQKEEHNKLLKEYLKDAENFPAKSGIRLFVESSPLDNLQFYEVVESCGAVVVGEDNCWGNRYSDVPIGQTINPFESIVDRYLKKSPCPRAFPLQRRIDYCANSAVESKAQGVLFHIYIGDNLQAWEAPEEIKATTAKGIPIVYLKKQPYLLSDKDKDELRVSIREFIKTIR